jgi:hypothetical protein
MIDGQWTIHFPPLHPNHPLQRLYAQLGSFDTISSLLGGVSMQEITLQETRRTNEGGLKAKNGESMDKIDVFRLVERAKVRGIELCAMVWDEETFLIRDEVTAAAAGTISG